MRACVYVYACKRLRVGMALIKRTSNQTVSAGESRLAVELKARWIADAARIKFDWALPSHCYAHGAR